MSLAASPVLAKANSRSSLSHKAVAAGIGWQGKSLLTVGPEYGPRIRLVTVLTGAELNPDTLARNRCGGGTNGTGAYRPEPSGTCPPTRTTRQGTRPCVPLHCVHRMREINAKMEHIGSSIYGVRLRDGPWGGKKRIPAA